MRRMAQTLVLALETVGDTCQELLFRWRVQSGLI